MQIVTLEGRKQMREQISMEITKEVEKRGCSRNAVQCRMYYMRHLEERQRKAREYYYKHREEVLRKKKERYKQQKVC